MHISKLKSLFFTIFLTLLAFAIIEAGVRGYFYATTLNPYYLYFGWGIDQSEHDNHKDGYFKFFPSTNLQQGTRSHSIPTKINSHGFRGQDFSVSKGEGRRIVTMGGSSTFGYYSRDDYTYPSIMQSYLNEPGNAGGPYEVINVGIPHMQTKHIVKMLEAEVLSFKPDVITLYTGCNDTWNLYGLHGKQNRQKTGRIKWLVNWIKYRLNTRSLAFNKANELYLNSNLSTSRFKHKISDDGLNKTVTYIFTTQKITREEFEKLLPVVLDEYQANLQQVANLARDNAIELLFVKQKYTLNKLRSRNEAESFPYASAGSYYEEARMAEKRLQQQGWLWLEEASMIAHASLMDILEKVAKQNDITVVDGIGALDGNPEYLKSYVHLSEEGNAVLARIVADSVLQLLASEKPG